MDARGIGETGGAATRGDYRARARRQPAPRYLSEARSGVRREGYRVTAGGMMGKAMTELTPLELQGLITLAVRNGVRAAFGAMTLVGLLAALIIALLRYGPVATDPRILVDASSRDDAAVFQVAPDRAIVATVDFFTPLVDDPYDFGRIAATNAFSDVYAMGGTPLLALNLVGWPREGLSLELLGEVLRGGAEVAGAAGAFVLGGHSVDDPEPKYGMVAIGEVHPDRIVRNSGARPGDALVLTKPLGTGVLTTALKRDLLTEADLAPAVAAMTTLNAGAARAMLAMGKSVHAATDVTGFGLLGHARTLLEASGVAAELAAAAVPLLPHARQ